MSVVVPELRELPECLVRAVDCSAVAASGSIRPVQCWV